MLCKGQCVIGAFGSSRSTEWYWGLLRNYSLRWCKSKGDGGSNALWIPKMRCLVGEACVGVRGKLHVESIGCRMMNQSHDEAGRRNAAGFLVQFEVFRSPSYAGAGRKWLRADEGWCDEDASGEGAAWICGCLAAGVGEMSHRVGWSAARAAEDDTSLRAGYRLIRANQGGSPFYSTPLRGQPLGCLAWHR